MSINRSARQLLHPDIESHVVGALRDTGIDPERIILEITESALFEDLDRVLGTIARVHALGVRLALDDFGTGYPSLTYLRKIPADVLKIDQTFIAELDQRGSDSSLVSMLIALGYSLDLEIVAEGIQTPEQRDELLVLGCTTGQGFYFAKPLPAGEITPA